MARDTETPTRRMTEKPLGGATLSGRNLFEDITTDETFQRSSTVEYGSSTQRIDSPSPDPHEREHKSDAGVTKLVRPRPIDKNKNTGSQVAHEQVSSKGSNQRKEENCSMEDPVVGWLVVISGPGKGMSLPIGYGMNAIGRADSQRISLDFGDEEISRESHAVLSYDQKGRLFYIQHGGGKNLTYLEDESGSIVPVLTPTPLASNQRVHLGGETVLHFISFCSKNFDWEDLL